MGGDRPSHSMSQMRKCGETTANPKEAGGVEGEGPWLLDTWLACDLVQVTSALHLGQTPVLDRLL